jgi:hypothetical protein
MVNVMGDELKNLAKNWSALRALLFEAVALTDVTWSEMDLCTEIGRHPTLTNFSFVACGRISLGFQQRIINQILANPESGITTLDLSNNGFLEPFMQALFEALAKNRKIHTFRALGNNIGDQFHLYRDLLRHNNKTLRSLSIGAIHDARSFSFNGLLYDRSANTDLPAYVPQRQHNDLPNSQLRHLTVHLSQDYAPICAVSSFLRHAPVQRLESLRLFFSDAIFRERDWLYLVSVLCTTQHLKELSIQSWVARVPNERLFCVHRMNYYDEQKQTGAAVKCARERVEAKMTLNFSVLKGPDIYYSLDMAMSPLEPMRTPWARNQRKSTCSRTLVRLHRLLGPALAQTTRKRVCFQRVMDVVSKRGFATDKQDVFDDELVMYQMRDDDEARKNAARMNRHQLEQIRRRASDPKTLGSLRYPQLMMPDSFNPEDNLSAPPALEEDPDIVVCQSCLVPHGWTKFRQ